VHPAGVRDGPWSDGFARLSRRSRPAVLTVHLAAHNSAWFYGLSLLAKPLSTAMLPREAVAPGKRRIGVSIGPLISAEELERRSTGSTERAAKLMRRHVYRVGQHRGLICGG
jgi:putative hemolysin